MTGFTASRLHARSPTGSGSRATSGSTSTSPWWAASAACWSSTPTASAAAAARGRRGRTPPRRRRGHRHRQHALALRPHLRQRRVPRGVRRPRRSTPTRPPATSWQRGAEDVKQRYADDPRRPAPRRRRWPPRIVLPDHTFSSAPWCSTSATGWSSWCTPAAGTPAATSWCGCPTPTCCSPATWSRSPRPPSFNDDSWPMDWPLSLDIVLGLTTVRRRGRAGPRRPGRPRLRRGAAQHDRHRRRDDPRPRHPRRPRSTRRSRPASGPGRGSAWRPPCAAATSSCPAARSGSRLTADLTARAPRRVVDSAALED